MKLPIKTDSLLSLEKEIAALEKELGQLEAALNGFESRIRVELQSQILRIRQLTFLYKQQKAAKKAKRTEQKKKGKNYKEPKGIVKLAKKEQNPKLSIGDKQELKRLYKEAIVHVHPDKFPGYNEEQTLRATNLTTELNALYKRGDLEELNSFHEHIISGNAMSHQSFQVESIVDKDAMLSFLLKKKNSLQQSLAETMQSELYKVFTSDKDLTAFIDELRSQFEQRIVQLEKRTKKGKN
ncbi:hypothetical protein [Solitalea koreensis]|uniref:J domain-containing protein n=1 Tax=Solitalea koreensis TaxID=543615 RepID=A0A521E143_9SPHI|nr:hypothetical protein [Solitalea koreensis]SMO77683.1 hypothetical protein SAMN06265350_11021 [Solitalea koreensis]